MSFQCGYNRYQEFRLFIKTQVKIFTLSLSNEHCRYFSAISFDEDNSLSLPNSITNHDINIEIQAQE